MNHAILVCGDDAFLVERKTRELLATPDALTHAVRVRETMDVSDGNDGAIGAIVQRAIESLQTPDFFAPSKWVWVKNAESLLATQTTQTRAAASAAATLVDWIGGGAAAPGATLLVSAASVHRASRLFRAFKSGGDVHDFTVGDKPRDRRTHARNLLGEMLHAADLRMSTDVQGAFLDQVGLESCRIHSEVKKLDAYLGDRREATEADLLEIVSPGAVDAAWDLTDAIGLRDPDGMLRSLRRLFAQRQNAMGLVALVENRVRDLLVFRQALDGDWLQEDRGRVRWQTPPPAVAAALEGRRFDPRTMHPFRAGRLAAQARHYSLRELRNARYLLMILRERMVSTAVDPALLLELTLLRILGRTPRAPLNPAPRGRA